MTSYEAREAITALLHADGSDDDLSSAFRRYIELGGQNSEIILGNEFDNRRIRLDLGDCNLRVRFLGLTPRHEIQLSGNFERGISLEEIKGSVSLSIETSITLASLSMSFARHSNPTVKLSIQGTSHNGRAKVGGIELSVEGGNVNLERMALSNVEFSGMQIKANLNQNISLLYCKNVSFIAGMGHLGPFVRSDELKFIDCLFNDSFSLPDSVLGRIFFDGSRFQSPFNCNTNFQKAASFKNAVFEHDVSIQGGFGGCADFSFSEGANFNFTAVRFTGSLIFKNAQFLKIRFTSPLFFSGADFSNLDLPESEIDILGRLDHQSRTEFDGDLRFVNSKLQRFRVNKLDVLGRILFSKSICEKLIFDQCKILNQAEFEDCTFVKFPEFFGTSFFPDTSFARSIFLDETVASEGAYRFLKSSMASIGHEVEENLFGGFELAARKGRLSPTGDRIERLLMVLYRKINDYGRDPFRPARSLINIFSIGFLVSLLTPYSFFVSSKEPWTLDLADSLLLRSLFYSGINTLGPLKLIVPGAIFQQASIAGFVIATAQAILSSVLWFFLILGVRRRFRTK